MKKKKQLRQKIVSILVRTKNYIYKLCRVYRDKTIMFNGFMKDTKLTQYKFWKLSEDKSLYHALFEWIIDSPLKLVFIGFMLSLAQPWFNWYQCTMGYWLLFKVLWLIRRGQ